jgi:cytochrome c oxidase subunit 4
MTKEWQEASNALMKEKNMNPITGISSTGYKGPGQVQESRNIKESSNKEE